MSIGEGNSVPVPWLELWGSLEPGGQKRRLAVSTLTKLNEYNNRASIADSQTLRTFARKSANVKNLLKRL